MVTAAAVILVYEDNADLDFTVDASTIEVTAVARNTTIIETILVTF